MEIKTDCVNFSGYKPCQPHKLTGAECATCSVYQRTDYSILIIKLGAAGEVLRNTALLHKLILTYPNSRVFWLTNFPDLVPEHLVYKVLPFTLSSVTLLLDCQFDVIFSLDKDLDACALANQLSSKQKKGFKQENGSIIPFDCDAERKWETGIDDKLMRENTDHYLSEIFSIAGFSFNDEPYCLPHYTVPEVKFGTAGMRIALNTGVGEYWETRKYSEERWIELAQLLIEQHHNVTIVGGPKEDLLNGRISNASGAHYFGVYPYREFIGLMSLFDLIVTSVSFALHVGIALEKKIVLLNNIFNKNEFYLYGRGTVLEPDIPCLMCYKHAFDAECYTDQCMDLIDPQVIAREINLLQ